MLLYALFLRADTTSSVSPSVYVSYTNLIATVNCVLTAAVQTGRTYNTLIAYPPEALSTQACTPLTGSRDPFSLEDGFKAINYTQMEQQTDFCSIRSYPVIGNDKTWTSEAVPFYLSFPPGLSLIDPAWKSCKIFEPGVLDPPRTLNKATALVGLGEGGSQTSTAAPGAKPTPGQVSATPTPTAENGGNDAAGLPTPLPGSQESDPPIVGPPEDNGGNGGGGPGGAAGNNQGDPNPGAANTQAAGLASPPEGSNEPSVDGDPPSPSVGNYQIEGTGGGGIVFGSTTLRPGDQTTKDGTLISVGSGSVVIGDSTILLAAPTGDVSDPNSVVEATPDPVIVGGNTVNRLPGGGVLIAGSTYSLGSHTTISGIAVSVATDNVILDGVTYTLPSQITPTPVLFGGQTIAVAKASNGGIIIGSSTYLPGTQANVFGSTVSVGGDNIVVDGSTYTLPTYPTSKMIVIDGKSIARASNGGIVIGDSTIPAGSQATISGHVVSDGVSSVVVDGSTYALPTDTISEDDIPQSLTLANGVIISAGGMAATISGTTYAIPSDARVLLVNGKTMALPTGFKPVFTVAGQIFTANANGFIVGGYTILQGGSAITLSGTVVSLGPSGLQVGSSTTPLAFPQETAGLQSVFKIAGQTFTANPTGFAVDGHSVSVDGPAVTLSGTPVSLGPDGLQIGSTTWPLTPAQETADVGLGGLILFGFGGGAGAAANVSSPLAFTGGGPRLGDGVWNTVLVVSGMCVIPVIYILWAI